MRTIVLVGVFNLCYNFGMALITSTITYYRSTYFTIDVSVAPPDPLTASTALFTVKADPYDDSATDTTAIIGHCLVALVGYLLYLTVAMDIMVFRQNSLLIL